MGGKIDERTPIRCALAGSRLPAFLNPPEIVWRALAMLRAMLPIQDLDQLALGLQQFAHAEANQKRYGLIAGALVVYVIPWKKAGRARA